MIVGVGIDLVAVERVAPWLTCPGLLERYFSEEERREVKGRGRWAARSLAACFAAKEAFGKALGRGLRGIRLKDISVAKERGGRPRLVLLGTARQALLASCGGRVHLGITYEKEWTMAQVLIEREDG